jgi:hypothetical protein
MLLKTRYLNERCGGKSQSVILPQMHIIHKRMSCPKGSYFTSDREATFQQQAYPKRFCAYIKVDDSRYFKKGNCENSTPALF